MKESNIKYYNQDGEWEVEVIAKVDQFLIGKVKCNPHIKLVCRWENKEEPSKGGFPINNKKKNPQWFAMHKDVSINISFRDKEEFIPKQSKN